MRNHIEARLAELESEIEVGERRWQEVNLEQARLRETLTRMVGAIQILREVLDAEKPLNDAPEQSKSDAKEGRLS